MTSTNDSLEILIVAAEASSTLYAQRLLEHWAQHGPQVHAFGIGSQAMESLGFEILGRSEELAVVGFQEVLSHWTQIKRAFYELLHAARTRRPRLALLLDYPDFNLRLARRLKALGIPVVYYISPQVWAWRKSRVHLIRRVVDQMLVIFPFEESFYQTHHVPVQFVGHPLLDELKPSLFSQDLQQTQRQKYGINKDDFVLALMPGSRHSELQHHLPLQLKAAQELIKRHPNLKVMLLVAPTFNVEEMKKYLENLDIPIILIKDDPFVMISLADLVLCASGTATLMVGLLEKPMVIMYRMKAITAWFAKRFVRSTPHFGLINLVLGERVVPELFQEQAQVSHLVDHLGHLILDPQDRLKMTQRLSQAKQKLGQSGATQRVAATLERLWSQQK